MHLTWAVLIRSFSKMLFFPLSFQNVKSRVCPPGRGLPLVSQRLRAHRSFDTQAYFSLVLSFGFKTSDGHR